MVIPLTDLKPEQSGTVIEIIGGHGIVSRLNAMGIIPGKKITKVSAMFMQGPVTIQVGSTTVALGYGMAKKIIINITKDSK